MATQLTTEALYRALADAFRAAVEAVAGNVLSATDAPAPSGSGWSTPITASGCLEGQLTLWIDDAGVIGIAKAMMGMEEMPEPSVAADMLKELWAQATAATIDGDGEGSGFEGLALVAGATTAGTLPGQGLALVLTDGATRLATLVMTGSVTAGRVAAPVKAPTATTAAGASGAGRSDYPGNLAALLDIDLPLVVRFARTEMSLRALAQLGPGSMVEMGRSPDGPVQLLIGSQVVAEGEVVVVSGNYGVRITSLVSPADRLRAMEL
jgi:flagellar motor switch protein FliN